MILQLVAIAAILGIAYGQMRQGLFSALIMTVITILSGTLAMVMYHDLALLSGLYETLPLYTDALSLMVLFLIPLFVLRFLADKFVRGEVLFHLLIERIGAAACGLVTGIVMIGMLIACMHLLPFGRVILTYRPFDDTLRRDMKLIPFVPDDAVASLGYITSAGSLSYKTPLAERHPNLWREAFCTRNTTGLHGSLSTPIDAMKLEGIHEAQTPENFAPADKQLYRDFFDQILDLTATSMYESDRLVIARVRVSDSAADPQDGWWRLPATHFRLRCRIGTTDEYRDFYPVGYLFYDNSTTPASWSFAPPPGDPQIKPALLMVARDKEAGKDGDLTIDWVYRLPDNAVPLELTFRRVARVAIDASRRRELFPFTEFYQDALSTKPPESRSSRGRRRRR